MKNQFTALVVAACSMAGSSHAQSVREAAIGAEISFAAQAKQAGTTAAFLACSAPTAFVADEGRLANAREVWQARPHRPGSSLAWYPVLADVAQSGDLAYTTGPWTQLQNGRPQLAGEYVRVWRKQPDGAWKFVVDMSVERVGSAPAQAAVVPQPRLLAAAATPSTAPSSVVLDVDRKFANAEWLKPGLTYQQYLSTEARLYRPSLSLMQGAAASANMKNLDGSYLFTATTGYLSAAGDLGYVVGTMRRPGNAKRPDETGSYLRIWRREAVAGWRLVLEVFNFAPNPATADAAPADGGRAAGQLPTRRTE